MDFTVYVAATSSRRNDLDPDDDGHGGQGRSLPRSPSRLPGSGNSTPRSSISLVCSPISGEPSPAGDDAWWPGDPEAIQSIRRPRKSVARLKMEQRWNRSHSVKERAVSGEHTPKRKSVARSKSMREPSGADHVTDPELLGPSLSVEHLSDSIGRLDVASQKASASRMRKNGSQSEVCDLVAQS